MVMKASNKLYSTRMSEDILELNKNYCNTILETRLGH